MPLPNTFAAASARGYGAFGFQTPSDPNFSSVSLLLPGNGTNGAQNNTFLDSSTNNLTITRNGNATQGSFSPFPLAANTAYSPAVNGGSSYFDGSGDFLGVANNAALDLNTTFTVEGWFYQPASGNGMFFARGGGAASWSLVDGHEYQAFVFSGLFYWQFNSGGSPVSITVAAPAAGAWHHFAAGYNGTTTRVWLNGSSIGTSTNGYSLPTTRNITRVGLSASSTEPLTGYVSSLRVVKGTDVYGVGNTSITVPTAPLTAITNTSLLLNFTNGAIYDAAAKNDLETVGNAQTSTAQSKWGGSSMYFDGTGDYLDAIDNTLTRLSGEDFTVEAWVYLTGNQPQFDGGIASYGATSTSVGWTIALTGSSAGGTLNRLVYGVNASASGGAPLYGVSGVPLNTWTHIAVTKFGTTVRFFINGNLDTSGTVTATPTVSSSYFFYVGTQAFDPTATTRQFAGYINDLRITKGVARYTSNFTPPTAPFPVR